jgi:hypothetical protein
MSAYVTFRKCRNVQLDSAMRTKADVRFQFMVHALIVTFASQIETSLGRQTIPSYKPARVASACPSPCGRLARRANFRFTQTPNQRFIAGPSRSDERGGRASSRTRDGMWWTRERRRATAVAGRVEPRERFPGAQDDRRCSVRQNRVVLAPVAGVKLSVVKSIPTGDDQPSNRQRR